MKISAFVQFVCALAIAGLAPVPIAAAGWEQLLQERLPFYGHRNWIVIADSAYPAQSGEGIETILANASQIEVVKTVLADLATSKHVRPIIYNDEELHFVEEDDAPGITQYRARLNGLLGTQTVNLLPHEQVIMKLDDAGQTFKVLIIKTNMKLPYTSVFIQLDCAYWSAESETKLRDAMAAAKNAKP